jgi:hypothetical protein
VILHKIYKGSKSTLKITRILFINGCLEGNTFRLFFLCLVRVTAKIKKTPFTNDLIKVTGCTYAICLLVSLVSLLIISLIGEIKDDTVTNQIIKNDD